MLEIILDEIKLLENSVVIEVGAGASTVIVEKICKKNDCIGYTLEIAEKTIERVSKTCPSTKFILGPSLDTLPEMDLEQKPIGLLFLDGAPSAMMTFLEFQLMQSHLIVGSIVLIDNATMYEETISRESELACRKGRVIVPYLRAHPFWEVKPYPQYGGGMVMAILRDEPSFCKKKMDNNPGHVAKYL